MEKQKSQEIVTIDPKEFGLTDETAKNIQDQFKPMLDKMVELEGEFNEVANLPIDDLNTSKKAKELRLKFVKVRTGTAEIHKAQKAFFLNGGRFVDGWKNAQLFASQGKELKLEAIENHFENLEKQRLEELQLERVELIRPYVDDTTSLVLSTMESDVWDAYFFTKKKHHEDKIEAEKQAEISRIEKEKAERKAIKDQAKENERLRVENEKREKELEAEKQKAEQLRLENEAKLKSERDKAEQEKQRIEAENNERLRVENEKREKLEADLKAKEEKEKQIEDERLAKIEAERIEAEKLANSGIKNQLNVWVNSLTLENPPIENDLTNDILLKFEAFKKWSLSQIETL